VLPFDGFSLYVDAESYEKALKGLTVDFQQDALSSGFVFINPNKKANVAAEFLSACDVQIAQLQSKAHVNVIQTSNMPH